MPLKSKAQARFLHAKKPRLAKKMEKETPKATRKRLPEKKRKASK
jgi:hypothetical protein